MEELKKIEVEETVKSIQTGLFNLEKQQVCLPSTIVGLLDSSNKWLLLSDFTLSPGLFADLGIFRSIGTSSDIRSGF